MQAELEYSTLKQEEIGLAELYEADETAWLEAMAALVRRGALDELDHLHLGEYLADKARCDRREVESRLIVLIAGMLKWVHQPEQRTRGWRATIIEQRQELGSLIGRGVLRAHAENVLTQAYGKAVERAAAETGLPMESLADDGSYSLDEIMAFEEIRG